MYLCLFVLAVLYVNSASSECSALFSGEGCSVTKPLPSCMDSPFRGSWYTLNKNTVTDPGPKSEVQDKWQLGVDLPRSLKDKLPPQDIFGSLALPIPKCALVSNGYELLGHKYGREIDSNDVVFRINNAPTKGFEEQVGRKTTIRLTNSAYQGWREVDSEAVLAKFCSGLRECGLHRELLSLMLKKAHPLNPAFLKYIEDTTYFKSHHEMPTSGTIGLFFLLHTCQQVTLYGFKGDTLKKWYFCKRPGGSQIAHNKWLREIPWHVESWKYASSEPMGAGPAAGRANRALPSHDPKTACKQDSNKPTKSAIGSSSRWGPNRLRPSFGGHSGYVGRFSHSTHRATTARQYVKPQGRRLLEHSVSHERKCMDEFEKLGFVKMKP